VADERVEAPFEADERTMLVTWLDYERATLAIKCAGLTDAQLRERSAPPSTMSLLGLVRHMAEVERGWFQRGVAGRDAPRIWCRDNIDADFDDVDTAEVAEAFAHWEDEKAEARRITAEATLEGTFSSRGAPISVRWVLVHMIEEYARHNGHADLLRERIDGATGE
jgi:uncharacterized damage-inducible protein DinB